MPSGAYVLLLAVLLVAVVGLWRLRVDGRFAPGQRALPDRPVDEPDLTPAAEVVHAAGAQLGERVTLVQFSSAFCAPCRTTRVVLADVAGQLDGVVHVEIDAEQHLAATRALGILRTPTTVVLDADGVEVTRASGAPTRDQVLVAVDQVLGGGAAPDA